MNAARSVHRGDASLTVETLAHAVGARLGQQQGSRARDVLQPREVSPQIRFTMQIDVEGADVEALEVEVFGRREIHVREEAIGRRGLDILDRARAGIARCGGGRAIARSRPGSRCRRRT